MFKIIVLWKIIQMEVWFLEIAVKSVVLWNVVPREEWFFEIVA